MSLAGTTDRKTERRLDVERPFRREQEAAVSRNFERGAMPRNFEGLLAWLKEVSGDDPSALRIHKNELWRDYGEHASGGSRLGAPAFDDQFRRQMDAPPSALDDDGSYVWPFKAMCSRLRRKQPAPVAWHIEKLASLLADPVSGGWRRLAMDLHMDETMCRFALNECLVLAWKEYQVRGMLT